MTPKHGLHRALGHLDPEKLPASYRILLHARLATTGDPADPTQLQPCITYGHAVAHNGTALDLMPMVPGAETDTEALAALYAKARQDGYEAVEALQTVLGLSSMAAWVIVIQDTSGALLASSRKLRLYHRRDVAGVYLASGRFAGAELLPEGERLWRPGV